MTPNDMTKEQLIEEISTKPKWYASPQGRLELLGLMKERKDWAEFFIHLQYELFYVSVRNKCFINIDYILDDTGKLARACLEWLRRRQK
jgi:hypothetical protein